jgi:hypothetical protein
VHTPRALFRFPLSVYLPFRSGRPDNLLWPLVTLLYAADALVFLGYLSLFDFYLVHVNLLLLIIYVPLIKQLPLVQHLEVLDAELRLVRRIPLEVVVQFLLIQEGVLTRQLLVHQLKVRVKLMPVGVAWEGTTTTPTRILEKVLLDLDVIIKLDEVGDMCLKLSLWVEETEGVRWFILISWLGLMEELREVMLWPRSLKGLVFFKGLISF